jgi:tetratricopeptide (TPR) repeat protein
MMAVGRQPTGEEDLYSILGDDEYNQVLALVQDLTQGPITQVDSGLKLNPQQVEDLQRGIDLTKQLIAYQPTQFGPYFVMAKSQYALGNIDEAIRNGEQALLLIPTEDPGQEVLSVHAELAHTLATYYYDKGSYKRAEELADTAVQIHTTNPDYLATAGAIKAQLGLQADAREYANLALALDPKNVNAIELDKALREAGY